MSSASPNKLSSIWKEWRHLIVFGSFMLIYLVGFKAWSHWQADKAIVPDYRRYLDHLVTHSSKAAQYEAEYFRTHQRATIASRHFEHVCGAMTALAVEDGFMLADFPHFPAEWCHQRSAYVSEFLQPR